LENLDRGIPLASLKVGEITLGDPGLKGQPKLRKMTFLPEIGDSLAELGEGG
jgi:hypothetical protein